MSKQTTFLDEPFKFGGKTYQPKLYEKRLSTALGRVYSLMRDGRKRTLSAIAAECGCSEAGASARLRDLRKPKARERYPNRSINSERSSAEGVLHYWMET